MDLPVVQLHCLVGLGYQDPQPELLEHEDSAATTALKTARCSLSPWHLPLTTAWTDAVHRVGCRGGGRGVNHKEVID